MITVHTSQFLQSQAQNLLTAVYKWIKKEEEDNNNKTEKGDS